MTHRSVLIVDDFLEDRATYRRYLAHFREANYVLLETDTGERGLKLCRERQLDCVLLDYSLPDMNGLEFLTELRRSKISRSKISRSKISRNKISRSKMNRRK